MTSPYREQAADKCDYEADIGETTIEVYYTDTDGSVRKTSFKKTGTYQFSAFGKEAPVIYIVNFSLSGYLEEANKTGFIIIQDDTTSFAIPFSKVCKVTSECASKIVKIYSATDQKYQACLAQKKWMNSPY